MEISADEADKINKTLSVYEIAVGRLAEYETILEEETQLKKQMNHHQSFIDSYKISLNEEPTANEDQYSTPRAKLVGNHSYRSQEQLLTTPKPNKHSEETSYNTS